MATRQLRIDAQRTVDNILETARVMLIENPQTSTTEIADRAQVHRTTLARHFPTREALTEQLLQRSLVAIEARIAEARTEEGDAREALRRATLAWADEAQNWRTGRYAPIGAVRVSGESPGQLRARMLALIERGQREGTLRDDLPALSLYWVWAGMTMTFNTLRADQDPEVLADEAVTVLSRAN